MQIPRHWRLNSQRYALQGVTCPHCAANIFPPREVCPHCESQVQTPYQFEQRERKSASLAVSPALSQAAR